MIEKDKMLHEFIKQLKEGEVLFTYNGELMKMQMDLMSIGSDLLNQCQIKKREKNESKPTS